MGAGGCPYLSSLLNYKHVGKYIPYPGSPVGPSKVAIGLDWMTHIEGFPGSQGAKSLVFGLPAYTACCFVPKVLTSKYG